MLYQRFSGVHTGNIAEGERPQIRKQLERCPLREGRKEGGGGEVVTTVKSCLQHTHTHTPVRR